jgi:hypothetical protein
MPDSAVKRTTFARFCLAVFLAAAAPGNGAQAARDAHIWPEQNGKSHQLLYSIMDSDVTLAGFNCDVINSPSATAFTAEPDYREMPVTVGLEVLLDEVSALGTPSSPARMDDASGGETRTPLSVKVSRMLIQQEISTPPDDGQMEDVFVPEASMGVADLVALCAP